MISSPALYEAESETENEFASFDATSSTEIDESLADRLNQVHTFFTVQHLMAHADLTQPPTDDFFWFMNGQWLQQEPIPSDKSSYGTFMEVHDRTLEQQQQCLQTLLEKEELEEEEQKIVDLYHSYMDTDTLEKLGVKPIQNLLASIDQVDSNEKLAAVMGYLHWIGVKLPFGVGVGIDSKREDTYTLTMGQSGLGMPDRDYYLSEEGKYPHYREAYHGFVTRMMQSLGRSEQDADVILAIETLIAQHHWSKVQCRDPEATYHVVELSSIGETLGESFPWQEFLAASRCSDVKTCLVRQIGYFQDFDQIFSLHSLEHWKTYLTYHCVNHFASYLNEDFQRLRFDFYGKVLSGLEQPEPREKQALHLIDGVFGELMGKQYVQTYFPESSKQKLQEMIELIKEAFVKGIEKNSWMSEQTKARALNKLKLMRIKIGYPDVWRDYDSVVVQKDCLVDNIISSAAADSFIEMNKLKGPVDRHEWLMLPHEVNAYNMPVQNEICFPAGILQRPFFDADGSDAQNFGAIGAIIGHEISHSFDDQGRKYDERGQLCDWWTEEDAAEFEARVQALVQQYNDFEPIPGAHVNGELTLGENIADLTGLTMAYNAYKKKHKDEKEWFENDLNPKQVLMMSWGTAWRSCMREDALRNRLATDPHSPGQYRCNGILSNFKPFYKHFKVTEDDAMFLPEEQRVKLW